EAVADGRRWASWDQEGEVDCHHLALTIELPPCDWSALRLSSPWMDGVAINDNLYVLVDGETIWTGGTSYGLTNGDGPIETGGWMASQITLLPAELLGEGLVTIDLVVEEREEWGGMGYIEPSLVP
ncbi:MAG: hypothetical protein QGG40_16840, partial [Myxococcota bacterium]|nr:hypothetical protein [Myxococcota bacterium]